MKKIAAKVIALLLAAMMVAAAVPAAMFAETAPSEGLPEGVTVTYTLVTGWNHKVDFTITIGENVDVDRINLGDLFELADVADMQYLPASTDTYTFTVVDNSGKGYTYEPQSVTISTPEFHVFTTDNGYSTVMWRCFNEALGNGTTVDEEKIEGLGLKDTQSDLSHESVGAKLRTKGYGEDDMSDEQITAEYLDDFYVAYYNAKYKENATKLSEVSMDFLRDMMNVDVNSQVRENNMDVAQYMGYRYFYEWGYTLSTDKDIADKDYIGEGEDRVRFGIPFMQYTDKSTDAYKSLDNLFTGLKNGQTRTFKTRIIGCEVWNQYQSFIFEQALSFNLVKSTKISFPGIDKKIVLADGEVVHDDIAAGEDVHFILRSNIGEDFAKVFPENYPVAGQEPNGYGYTVDDFGTYTFEFHDIYDPAFTIDSTSFVVKVNGEQLGTDEYTLTMDTENHTFTVAINSLVQLFLDGVFDYEDIGVAPITVEYTASTDGMEAGSYVNEAWVEYQGTETTHANVDVKTYKISVFKYDQDDGKALAGAEFALYGSKKVVTTNEDGTETIKYEIDTENLIAEAISDEDGYAIFDGLDIGIYYVVETKAPEGYVCNSDPLMVEITGEEEGSVVEISFANVKIPHTGGEGTTVFYAVGGAILACAAVMYVVSRRKASNNA